MPPIPDELMSLVAGGAGKSGPPPSAQPPGNVDAAPVGAPMTTPQPNEGVEQAAMVDMSMVLDLMEKVLSTLGSESESGRVVLDCLTKLSKQFGAKRKEAEPMQAAQLQQLMQSLPQGGGASPEMMALAQGGASATPPQGAASMQPPMQ